LATLAAEWRLSPSSKRQCWRPASIAAAVVLPEPETPITTATTGAVAGAGSGDAPSASRSSLRRLAAPFNVNRAGLFPPPTPSCASGRGVSRERFSHDFFRGGW